VLHIFRSEGFTHATKIGVMTQGEAALTIG